jgi:hypothetical protein
LIVRDLIAVVKPSALISSFFINNEGKTMLCSRQNKG